MDQDDFVERECLLFEAGEYPDRQVTITPGDLAEIAANTPAEVPVRVEHMAETPFDGALGVMTRVRADGGRLWGTLRQPVEAWRFVRRAGARALSIGLDLAARRIAEVSFVCRPRVAAAQVFSGQLARFDCPVFGGAVSERLAPCDSRLYAEEEGMTGVRQFADGVIQYIRGAMGAGEASSEPEELAAARQTLEGERAEQRLGELKRRGLMRATPEAEDLARAILCSGPSALVAFGEKETPLAEIFVRFLEANGAVVPVGEVVPASASESGRAAERLVEMAREVARRDGVPYVSAFSQVATAHPGLARAAREEGAA